MNASGEEDPSDAVSRGLPVRLFSCGRLVDEAGGGLLEIGSWKIRDPVGRQLGMHLDPALQDILTYGSGCHEFEDGAELIQWDAVAKCDLRQGTVADEIRLCGEAFVD